MSVNKVFLVGRLGQTPEKKYSASGVAVAQFNLATNEYWVDKGGQKQEKTEWHRVVVFGKVAENCAQYLTKGRQVFVEGKLQTRQWQDKDNQTRYTTEIVASGVDFLGSGQSTQTQQAGSGFGPSSAQSQEAPTPHFSESAPSSFMTPASPFTEDDIPF